MDYCAEFKKKLHKKQSVTGCFVKTPHPIVVEILAQTGVDFVILDAEHAPFDRSTLDACIMTARHLALPALVRIPEKNWILNILDAGAAGIVVPHVRNQAEAEAITRLCYYQPGGRGFAATTRAAQYGDKRAQTHLESANHSVSVICQIEDLSASSCAAAISGTQGVDGILVGEADLAVSAGLKPGSESVQELTRKIISESTCSVGLYCHSGDKVSVWASAGANIFAVGSDHTLLKSGAAAMLQKARLS